MTPISETDIEVIFDTLAKSAIVRCGTSLIWLEGPFRTYSEAVSAARGRMQDFGRAPLDGH